MLNIYDMNRRKSAVLQNAYDITETRELNKIYTLTFSLPATDEKAKYIQPFHYARYGEDGELYRIIKSELSDSDTSILKVECEHVIAMLVDNIMFGAIQYGGGTIKTSAVISFLLNKQTTKNWILSECDFDRRFEYLWEQENILNALYSIPKEFTKAYKWVFDTTVYPWKLSLKAIDDTIHPEYYIRAKRNMLASGTAQDYAGICTRIYPLGYGEGVNQLTIKEVNNGVEYLQSPDNIVAQYGIKEKVLVDRRFENAEALKEYAQTMLDGLQTPSMSRSFDVVDLYELTSQDIDNADVGKICKMTGDNTIAYITKTVRTWDKAGDLNIELSTKATDVASSIADLADRVRIESVYAQGATQLYQHSKDANATPQKGMVLNLYFPEEMRQINKVLLNVQLEKFRSYSKTTESNGGFEKTYKIEGVTNQEITSQENTENKTYTFNFDEKRTTHTFNDEFRTGESLNSDITTRETTISGTTGTKTISGEVGVTKITGNTGASTIKGTTGTKTIQGTTGTKIISGEVGVTKITGNTGASTIKGTTGVRTISGTTGVRTISGTITPSGAVDTQTSPDGDTEGTTSAASMGSSTISGSVTTNPVWPDQLSGFTSTDATPNGAVHLFQNGEKLYGGTYSYGYDGYHTHDYYGGEGEKAIDGGTHDHKVSVNTSAITAEVIMNDPYWGQMKNHRHSIALNGLSHTHEINISENANFGSHSHTFKINSHTHSISIPEHNHSWSDSSTTSVNGQNVAGHNHTWSDTSKTTINGETKNGHNHTWSDTSTVKVNGEIRNGHNHSFNDTVGHNHTWSDTSKTTIAGKEYNGHNHTWSDTSKTTIDGETKNGHNHTWTDTSKTSDGKSGHSHSFNDTVGHNHTWTDTSKTSDGKNGHNHSFNAKHDHKINIAHEHVYDISHKHTIDCPKHKHKITIPGQNLSVSIPAHTHDISAGIFESGNPTAFDIYVGGKKKVTIADKKYNGDISQWLLNADNKIPRSGWIKVEIRPNDLAYVVSSVFVQGFVQSRGGQNY